MTVAQMISMLSKANPNDTVLAYDPDEEEMVPVQGMVYGGGDGIVTIETKEE